MVQKQPKHARRRIETTKHAKFAKNQRSKPEPLRGNLSGYWSRRIDDANRLVYRATDSDLVIIACRFHYDGRALGTEGRGERKRAAS